jgi:hypothetical protein
MPKGHFSVVGGDCVDGAGDDAVDDRGDVAGGAQRGLHLEVAVVGGALVVGEGEVVRRGLAGCGDAELLGVGDHGDGVARGDVGDVEARAGHLGEEEVAGDHDVLGSSGDAAQAETDRGEAFMHVAAGAEVQVFAVVDDGEVESAGELHGAAHDAGVHDGAAVVGDGDDAGVLHGADGGQFVAGAVLGDGADGEDVGNGELAGAVDDVAGDGGIVVDGDCVWHAADGSESAGGGGAGAGLDGFGVLDAGLAEVDVHVDETGGDDEAGGVEDAGADGVEIGADLGDAAVLDGHVGDGVEAGGRVDDAAVLDD